jgi:hypothetical protein
MDISSSTISYAQATSAVVGGLGTESRGLEIAKTNLITEVVEGVQAAYDVADEVTLSRREARQEEEAARRNAQESLAAQDRQSRTDLPDDEVSSSPGGDEDSSAVVADPPQPVSGRGKAVDVVA